MVTNETKILKNKLSFRTLNEDSDKDWETYKNLGLECFPNYFENLTKKAKKVGWKNLKGEKESVYDEITFIEINGKVVGCFALEEDFGSFTFEQIMRNKSLLLKYLMISPKYKNKKLGQKVLNIILMFAYKNGFSNLQLQNEVDLRQFKNLEKQKTNEKNLSMITLINTAKPVKNLTKSIINSFLKRFNLKRISVAEQNYLILTIQTRYQDIVRQYQNLTFHYFNKFKRDNSLTDLLDNSITKTFDNPLDFIKKSRTLNNDLIQAMKEYAGKEDLLNDENFKEYSELLENLKQQQSEFKFDLKRTSNYLTDDYYDSLEDLTDGIYEPQDKVDVLIVKRSKQLNYGVQKILTKN